MRLCPRGMPPRHALEGRGVPAGVLPSVTRGPTRGPSMLALRPQTTPPPVQAVLAFARPLYDRRRSVRRPFSPSSPAGRYRLPPDVRERLSAALAPFRNRDAAFALA